MTNPFESINKSTTESSPKNTLELKKEEIETKRNLELSKALGGFSMIESKLKQLSQEYTLSMPEKEKTTVVEKLFTQIILMQAIPYDTESIDQFCNSVENIINEKYDKQIAELEGVE